MPRTHRWDVLLVIAAGGALGSLARYGTGHALPHPPGGFASATLAANVAGCLLIGVLMETVTRAARPHRLVRPFLGIGVLGGFTTMSTAMVDVLDSVRAGHPALAAGYLAASLAASLAAVVAGILVVRALSRRLRSPHGGTSEDPGGA
nr:CrcB family protein [Saccharomonospora saliphila]